jgi:hypothetical protein
VRADAGTVNTLVTFPPDPDPEPEPPELLVEPGGAPPGLGGGVPGGSTSTPPALAPPEPDDPPEPPDPLDPPLEPPPEPEPPPLLL